MNVLIKIQSFFLVCAFAAILPLIVGLAERYVYPFTSHVVKTEALKALEEKIDELERQQRDEQREEELQLFAYQKGAAALEEKMKTIKIREQELEELHQQARELENPLREQEYQARASHNLKIFIANLLIALLLVTLSLWLRNPLLQTGFMAGAFFISLLTYVSSMVVILTGIAWLALLVFLSVRLYKKCSKGCERGLVGASFFKSTHKFNNRENAFVAFHLMSLKADLCLT